MIKTTLGHYLIQVYRMALTLHHTIMAVEEGVEQLQAEEEVSSNYTSAGAYTWTATFTLKEAMPSRVMLEEVAAVVYTS